METKDIISSVLAKHNLTLEPGLTRILKIYDCAGLIGYCDVRGSEVEFADVLLRTISTVNLANLSGLDDLRGAVKALVANDLMLVSLVDHAPH